MRKLLNRIFKAEFEAIKELDRVMKLNDLLLRHMIIRLGE